LWCEEKSLEAVSAPLRQAQELMEAARGSVGGGEQATLSLSRSRFHNLLLFCELRDFEARLEVLCMFHASRSYHRATSHARLELAHAYDASSPCRRDWGTSASRTIKLS
jgi:hypothetical protein